ncbi:MAG: pyridoxamine 5'-phosphate oxidase family protein [Planctomycetaceae bacterium]|nr:pyridoxamine 5'-phosphate oxidase family protein [Planctomycetaceae bacterium]
MGKTYDSITPALADWIAAQRLFFVATAPLAADGQVNLSPKGMDSFRVLGPRQVAYLDVTGSGSETIAHVRENGRIVVMFCAFEGPPKIVRLHGVGTVVTRASADWELWSARFPALGSPRSILVIDVVRVSDSCGWGVPEMTFQGERDFFGPWAAAKGPAGVHAYGRRKNRKSIDGLPALDEQDL